MAELKNVVLVDGVRSAFGRGGRGKLVATRLDEAGGKVVRGADGAQPEGQPVDGRGHGPRQRHGRGRADPASAPNNVAHLAGLPAGGLHVRHQPPVRLEHGDAAPRRAVDHGRRDRVRHRRSASSAWAARSAAACSGAEDARHGVQQGPREA